MLPSLRPAVSQALRSTSSCPHLLVTVINSATVKPSTAVIPFRAIPIASISSSTPKTATALQPAQKDGPPLMSTGKPRREVPLASQEETKGALQYVL